VKAQDKGEANFLRWCEQEGFVDDEADALEWLETYRNMLRIFQVADIREEDYPPCLALYFSRHKGE